MSLPSYYHTLEPFSDFFKTGVPVLTYHKVGRRPFGVRLKGLYVPPDRFATQMEELRQAGFTTVDLDQCGVADNSRNQVVITFDDGCRNVLENTLEPLRQNGFRAIQFIVVDLMGKTNEWDVRDGEVPEPLMSESEVRQWLAAGHSIGSHSLRHLRLTRLSVRDAREEILTSKKKLEDMFGVSIQHFCYPYGDWSPSVRDLVAKRGIRQPARWSAVSTHRQPTRTAWPASWCAIPPAASRR